jgi:hypothetical protein
MSKQLFKDNMRLNRGRLSSKSMEANMDYIYDYGSPAFVVYMETTKKLGIDNAAKIVYELDAREQNKLIKWIDSKPASLPVSDIELKVIRIKGDR